MTGNKKNEHAERDAEPVRQTDAAETVRRPKEIGGRCGPEPTRYGDWERNGRCIDF